MDTSQLITPTTITQLGLSVVFLVLYLQERKASKEATRRIEEVYKENVDVVKSNTEAFDKLSGTISLFKESQKNALDNNTKAVDNLVINMSNVFRNQNDTRNN